MATLCLDESAAAPSLRDWLNGDWALVFSHPEDFQYQGLEHDRWLEILRDEFRARGVRPVACSRNPQARDASWVSELICDAQLVRVHEADAVGGDVIDLAARALREDLLGMPPRFALIVDQALRRRGVLKYSAGRSSVSPLDLLASIDALRRTPARQAA